MEEDDVEEALVEEEETKLFESLLLSYKRSAQKVHGVYPIYGWLTEE